MFQQDFRLEIICQAVAEGCSDIISISRRVSGIYPLELLELLELLVKSDYIIKSGNEYLTSHTSANKSQENQIDVIDLPLPHPHDYDWRFDQSTVTNLCKTIAGNNTYSKFRSILLLGAPSIFSTIRASNTNNKIVLIDHNLGIVHRFNNCLTDNYSNVIHHNLLTGAFNFNGKLFDISLCDPPWYVEYYFAFLAQAATSCKIGGKIFVALLPFNSRPNAHSDRLSIIDFAMKLGLFLDGIDCGYLNYETPDFEVKSLERLGLANIGNWRIGDLATFIKVQETDTEILNSIPSIGYKSIQEEDEWVEFLIGLYKIKLKKPLSDCYDTPQLLSIETNDILPTVSRRYEGRKHIDLWLWDNRVFKVQGKSAIWGALNILSGKSVYQDYGVSQDNLDNALILIRSLIG